MIASAADKLHILMYMACVNSFVTKHCVGTVEVSLHRIIYANSSTYASKNGDSWQTERRTFSLHLYVYRSQTSWHVTWIDILSFALITTKVNEMSMQFSSTYSKAASE